MAERRTLRFDRLDDAMAEVDRLLKGYAARGRWSLGQVCHHLSGSIIASVEGYGEKSPWPVRATVGRLMKRRVLRSGRMGDGAPLPEKLWPKPGLDDRAEAEALRATIRHFGSAKGPFADHPFFGPMTAEEWAAFHAIHAAHHLGFLCPEPTPPA